MLRRLTAVAVALLMLPAGTEAATTFGPAIGTVTGGNTCDLAGTPFDSGDGTAPAADDGCVLVNENGASTTAHSPVSGVVVLWRARTSSATGVPMRLRLLRATAGTAQSGFSPLIFAGTSATATVTSGAVVDIPTRLPIQAGDQLGLESVGSAQLYFQTPSTGIQGRGFSGVPDGHRGAEAQYSSPIRNQLGAPVQVVIESDADSDGFGDETQDQCTGSAGTLAGCKPGTITGTVANGAGATVYIDANANGAPDAGEQQSTADSGGAYSLGSLRPGTYAVRVQPTAMTTCDPGCQQSVTVNQDTKTANFTLFAAPAAAPAPGPAVSGNGGSAGQPAPARDTTAPVLSPLTLTHTRFAINRAGAVLAKVKPAKGTVLRFTTSEAGTGTFTISSVKAGRKIGRRCAAPGARPVPAAKRCTRTSPVAGFSAAAASGRNAVAFSGRVKLGAATKSLSAGRYRLALTIADAARNRSNVASATFTIIR